MAIKTILIHEAIEELNTNKPNTSNVLELDNTVAFTPTADYHPATKKYVDDNAGDLAAQIDAATAKTPLVDTDTFPLTEPTTLKKTLWSTIKSTLKTYFDGLYLALTGGTLTGDLTLPNIKLKGNTILADPTTYVSTNPAFVFDTVGNPWYATNWQHATYSFRLDGVQKIYLDGFGSLRFPSGGGSIQADLLTPESGGGGFIGHGMRRSDTTTGFNFAWGESISSTTEPGIDLFPVSGTHITNGILLRLSQNSARTSIAFQIMGDGKVGILTTAPDKQLEINSADGNCLRLTYNDNNGSATYYADFIVSSSGDLTITPSGGDIEIGSSNIHTTGALKGVHKANDGTNAIADGTYTVGLGSTTNGTLTIKDGIITAIQEAT